MAIQSCKECGGTVSDQAEQCPNCGIKIEKKYGFGVLGWLILIVVFGCVIALFGNLITRQNETNSSSSYEQNQAASEAVEAAAEAEAAAAVAAAEAEAAAADAQVIQDAVDAANNAPMAAGAEGINTENTNWQYSYVTDDMRGTNRKLAEIESSNTVNFEFPYDGGSSLTMYLRQGSNNKSNTEIFISVSKGQVYCGYPDCEVAFKFDDGAVESITMVSADNDNGETLFVRYDKSANRLAQKLKNSKTLRMEVPFYREGRRQFTFDVSGLKW